MFKTGLLNRSCFNALSIARWAGLALMAAPLAASAAANAYEQTNLVANKAEYHPQLIDAQMLNAWGLALRPPGAGGHIWISNARTGTSSEFIGDVPKNPLHQDQLKIVTLAEPAFTDHGYAFVTGQAYNSASDLAGQPDEFHVEGPAKNLKTKPATVIPGGYKGAAKFAFVTEDGCINAWSSATALSMDRAPVMIDYSKRATKLPFHTNCVFTGCALTNNAAASDAFKHSGGNHLFVADMRNNAILVFDDRWKDVTRDYHFQTPATVGELHPFNVVSLDGHLFVTYTKFDPGSDEGQEQIVGRGLGHLVEYNEDGTLVRDYQDEKSLNAPWGVAIAPATFGAFAHDLLVANFGDGTIAAFDPKSGKFIGYLENTKHEKIVIDGIWALAFGNGYSLGDANALYFTAGPNTEQDGLFGRLNAVEGKTETAQN
jgi:uncharacterized protein (TIGR03118 family)